MVFEPFAEQGEKFFEQERRGDHGRPSVVLEAVALKNLRPATEAGAAVDQCHLVAFGAQPQRCSDAAETGADHKCFHGQCLSGGVDPFGSTPL